MKFIFITFDGIGLSIAYRLQQEGNEIEIAQIQNIWELGGKDMEKPDERKKRLSYYDGILKKRTMTDMLSFMRRIQNKDEWFVIFDFNHLWKYSEEVLKMGFKNGFFPTKEDCDFEEDRAKAKEFVAKNYKGFKVAEVKEFKDIKEGIEFIEQGDGGYVLKGNDAGADTVCPTDKEPILAQLKLKNALEKGKKDYEKGGYILEKKIKDPQEFTPEMAWYNGKPVYLIVDIESKPIGAGDEGKQTGCSQCIVFQEDMTSEIAKLCFPPAIHEMAKKRKGLFVWDASILLKDDLYFGEFCPNRWGWDSIFNELEMCESVTDYFKSLLAGKNPFKYKFGASVRGFNPDKEEKELNWMEESDKNIWIYDVFLKDGQPTSTGCDKDLVVFTGHGNTMEEAVDMAYKVKDKFSYTNMYSRPKFDFLSTEYPTAIGHRYKSYLQKYD